MSEFLLGFCNVFPRGFALARYNFENDDLVWLDLPTTFAREVVSSQGMCFDRSTCYAVLTTESANTYLIVLDTHLKYKNKFPLYKVRDPHSIIAFDGDLFLVSAGNNRVFRIRINDRTEIVEEEYWAYDQAELDCVHMNSLVALNGEIYVSMFGPRSEFGWLGATNGKIVNIASGEVVCDGLSHPHSLGVQDGKLIFAESMKGQVSIIERQSGIWSKHPLFSVPSYARGVLTDAPFVLVGGSARRKRSKSTGEWIVDPVITSETFCSYLYRFDTDSRRIEKHELTAWAREIYDVVLLPENFYSESDDNTPARRREKSLTARLISYDEQHFKYIKDREDALITGKERLKSVLRSCVDQRLYSFAMTIIDSWESFHEQFHGDGEWHYYLALCNHLETRDYDKALANYEKALIYGFDEFWVRFYRGWLLRDLSRFAEAAADFCRAVEIRPDDQPASTMLHDLYKDWFRELLDSHQYPWAIKVLRELLLIEPNNGKWHHDYAFCLHMSWNEGKGTEDALVTSLEYYNKALELGYDEFWIKLHRSMLLRDLGHIEEARSDVQRSLLLQPSHETAHQLLQQLQLTK